LSRSALALVLILMIATSILLAFRTPTFDFDEALYRRVAEEMKTSQHYATMTWDGRPFLEKPPTYVWMIVGCSRLLDADPHSVSVIASRLPSLFFSTLTLLLLALFWHRVGPAYAGASGGSDRRDNKILLSRLLPPIAFGAALFPMVQVTSVMLDPMLTFFSTVVLVVFATAALRRDGDRLHLSRLQVIVAALAMTGAVAVKGLIGIVAPAIALVVHDILSTLMDDRSRSRIDHLRRRLGGTVMGTGPVFLLAIIFSTLVFIAFYREAGSSFLYEFLIRQHFGRGSNAFQGHKGPIFYYLLLLAFGGPAAALVWTGLGANKRPGAPFARWGFPLSWAIGLIAFISCLATKLPNYTWPAWPAIALSLCIVLVRATASDRTAPAAKPPISATIGAWTGILASALFSIVSITLCLGFHAIVTASTRSQRTHSILHLLEPLPLIVRLGLALISMAFAVQALVQWKFLRAVVRRTAAWQYVAAAAAVNCLVLILISQAVLPFVDETVRAPLVRIARLASAQQVSDGDLTTVALFSPTISSNYSGGNLIQLGARATTPVETRPHLFIAPIWQATLCEQKTSRLMTADKYLLLCRAQPISPNWPL
jgi:4-amino-4-deoxy-L-arabinose transferase-like glycosyltransferase